MKKRKLFSLARVVIVLVFMAAPLAAQETDRKFEDAARQIEEHARRLRADIEARFSGPEWQAKVKKMEEAAARMSRRVNSPEWQAQLREIDETSKDIDANFKTTFESPEWQEQVRRLTDLAARHSEAVSDQARWKKEMQQLQEQTRKMREEIRRYFESPEWREQIRQLQEAARTLGSSR